jgi:hypothetical protein
MPPTKLIGDTKYRDVQKVDMLEVKCGMAPGRPNIFWVEPGTTCRQIMERMQADPQTAIENFKVPSLERKDQFEIRFDGVQISSRRKKTFELMDTPVREGSRIAILEFKEGN